MLTHLRILGGMLAQADRFTTADLARYAGANPATVRTVLARERHRIEQIGVVDSKARGARPAIYRLREGQAQAIRARMKDTFRQLPPQERHDPESADIVIRNALGTAEASLAEARAEPNDAARADALEVVQSSLRMATRALSWLPAGGRRDEDAERGLKIAALAAGLSRPEEEPRVRQVRRTAPVTRLAAGGERCVQILILPDTDEGDEMDAAAAHVRNRVVKAISNAGWTPIERPVPNLNVVPMNAGPTVVVLDSFGDDKLYQSIAQDARGVLFLDVYADDRFRNRVLACEAEYQPHANRLTDQAMASAVRRTALSRSAAAVPGPLAATQLLSAGA